MNIQDVGFWDYNRAQLDIITTEEDPGFPALGIPKAWQNTATGQHLLKADFKCQGVKEEKKSRDTDIPATCSDERKTEGVARRCGKN